MNNQQKAILQRLFGDNRAEWPPEHFPEIFVEPAYITKLTSDKPCILVGGRGTGKTTSLQSLVYKSTFERYSAENRTFDDQSYLGVMVRMNKNRVRAFEGMELEQNKWLKFFTHYFNLLVCLELTEMTIWLKSKSETQLSAKQINHICTDLCIEPCSNEEELLSAIKTAISILQRAVNNVGALEMPMLSMAESPLITFCNELKNAGVIGERTIFCCIDEYENLLEYQQAAINTYIKHSEPPLSYKVGVRKNGLLTAATLDSNDLLSTPDDYQEIEISEEGFDLFAKAVANQRLTYASAQDVPVPSSLDDFLEEISISEEAEKLGASTIAKNVVDDLKDNISSGTFDFISSLPPTKLYFLRYWSEASGENLVKLANDWGNDPQTWETRLGNHQYASLFWITKGRQGTRVRKYYAGTRVLLSLASGNIRYFLELLNESVINELAALEKNTFSTENNLVISVSSQTAAASFVGQRRLDQLEGLADSGVKLKRLVLALGKIFYELARSPAGKTPEIVSFVLAGDTEKIQQVETLLREGIGHLAFEVSPKTKPTSSSEIRVNEYRLHPIFCAYFVFSHRRKRCTTFDARELLDILEDTPGKAISKMLGETRQSPEDDLPEQLAIFSSFFSEEE